MIKLTWDGINDEALTGYYVVRNSFHTPKHFMDGVKLYGGKDTYTYDNFASMEKKSIMLFSAMTMSPTSQSRQISFMILWKNIRHERFFL
ncbi:MAG: hypothetical protein IE885_04315 [Campylobacterales bacterium]|nr:hypothetical protein [Campylobacterales bacterium]